MWAMTFEATPGISTGMGTCNCVVASELLRYLRMQPQHRPQYVKIK